VNAAGPSVASNTVSVVLTGPAAPSGLTGAAVRITGNILNDAVTLNWSDNSNNENGFTIQRAANPAFTGILATATVAAGVTTFSQNAARLKTFYYRVQATNGVGASGWSNVLSVTTP
jgi:hypothetical protein